MSILRGERKVKIILLPVLLGKRWEKEKACPEELALELILVKFPDEGSQSYGMGYDSMKPETSGKTQVLTPVEYFAYITPFHSPSIEQKDFLSFGELD